MELIGRGRIDGGRLVLGCPLRLADGTEVVVGIEPAVSAPRAVVPEEEFTSLPFFGMWADRADMTDAAAWVRRERERWLGRITRQGGLIRTCAP